MTPEKKNNQTNLRRREKNKSASFSSYVFFSLDFFPVLMKCFNGFCKDGVVLADTVGEILQMMGLRVQKSALEDIIAEVDEDGKQGS